MGRFSRLIAVVALVWVWQAGIRAQAPVATSGVVTTAAPIFVLPDASRAPLRTLPEGTILTVSSVQGEWLFVEFRDPSFGSRRGYIQARFVKLSGDAPGEQSPQRPAGAAVPPTTRQGPLDEASEQIARLLVFGQFGTMRFAAGDSFTAVLGKRTGTMYGGDVQLMVARGPVKGLFFGVSADRFRKTGQRAFVFEGEVFGLGIPDTITVTPVLFNVGYKALPLGRVSPYGGGGVGSYQLQEKSDFAGEGEDASERFTGYHLLGGVEVNLLRWFAVAGEARWSKVKDAIGIAGVSQEFGEDDLGGLGLRLKVGVEF